MNWQHLRSQFPAAENQKYFFSAASGPLHKTVYEAYNKFHKKLYQKGDTQWMQSLDSLENTRELFRQYLNAASTADIAFGPNTSHNINLIAMMIKQNHPQAKILMPDEEFPSSHLPFIHHGFQVKTVPVDKLISSVKLENPDFVVCSAIQYSSGYRINLVELASEGIPLIVNATQSLGAFATDVDEIKPLALVGSCHKWLCAGYAASVAYFSPQFRENTTWPLAGWLSVDQVDLSSSSSLKLTKDSRAIEVGVLPYGTISALEAAMQVVLDIGVDNISQRILQLSLYLENKLIEKGLKQKKDSHRSGIICFPHQNPDLLVEQLEEKNIFISARNGKVRIAVHYFNNIEDIDALLKEL